MIENRLANPDAECPRCGATSPPTDARLVTCAACGLTFQPHELQRPHRPRELPDPPSGITVTRTPELVIARWRVEWWLRTTMAVFAIFMLALAGVLVFAFGWTIVTIGCGVFLAAFAYLGLVFTVNHVELAITHDALIRRLRPLRLIDSIRIPRVDLRSVRYQFEPPADRTYARHVVLVAGAGSWQHLLYARRADHGRYLAQLIANTCDLAPS